MMKKATATSRRTHGLLAACTAALFVARASRDLSFANFSRQSAAPSRSHMRHRGSRPGQLLAVRVVSLDYPSSLESGRPVGLIGSFKAALRRFFGFEGRASTSPEIAEDASAAGAAALLLEEAEAPAAAMAVEAPAAAMPVEEVEEDDVEEFVKKGLTVGLNVATRRAAVSGESDELQKFMTELSLGEILGDLGAGVGFKEIVEVAKDNLYSCFLEGGRWQAPGRLGVVRIRPPIMECRLEEVTSAHGYPGGHAAPPGYQGRMLLKARLKNGKQCIKIGLKLPFTRARRFSLSASCEMQAIVGWLCNGDGASPETTAAAEGKLVFSMPKVLGSETLLSSFGQAYATQCMDWSAQGLANTYLEKAGKPKLY